MTVNFIQLQQADTAAATTRTRDIQSPRYTSASNVTTNLGRCSCAKKIPPWMREIDQLSPEVSAPPSQQIPTHSKPPLFSTTEITTPNPDPHTSTHFHESIQRSLPGPRPHTQSARPPLSAPAASPGVSMRVRQTSKPKVPGDSTSPTGTGSASPPPSSPLATPRESSSSRVHFSEERIPSSPGAPMVASPASTGSLAAPGKPRKSAISTGKGRSRASMFLSGQKILRDGFLSRLEVGTSGVSSMFPGADGMGSYLPSTTPDSAASEALALWDRWEKRWFVLWPEFLVYFRDRPSEESSGLASPQLLGILPLRGAKVIDDEDEFNRSFGLRKSKEIIEQQKRRAVSEAIPSPTGVKSDKEKGEKETEADADADDKGNESDAEEEFEYEDDEEEADKDSKVKGAVTKDSQHDCSDGEDDSSDVKSGKKPVTDRASSDPSQPIPLPVRELPSPGLTKQASKESSGSSTAADVAKAASTEVKSEDSERGRSTSKGPDGRRSSRSSPPGKNMPTTGRRSLLGAAAYFAHIASAPAASVEIPPSEPQIDPSEPDGDSTEPKKDFTRHSDIPQSTPLTSTMKKRRGSELEIHLAFPTDFQKLIAESRPQHVFGLQCQGNRLWLAANSHIEKRLWIVELRQTIAAISAGPRVAFKSDDEEAKSPMASPMNASTSLVFDSKDSSDSKPVVTSGETSKSGDIDEVKPKVQKKKREKSMFFEPASVSQGQLVYSDLEILEKIGDGMYGEVFKGRIWGTDVAIKKLKVSSSSEADEIALEDLIKEVKILSELRHPNVILYIGACTVSPDVCIVTEWCNQGSLYGLLHKRSVQLDMHAIISIAMGIAQGMNYLHNLERKIIHRDLKSHNVLVTNNFQCKVADFGLSHVREKVNDSETQGGHYGVIGTPEWMAPEVMQGTKYTEKIDAYSFGIVLSELLTRVIPFHDQFTISSYMDVVDAVIDEGALPTIPEWCGDKMKKLIIKCLSRKPEERPSFKQILHVLRTHYQAAADRDPREFFQTYDVPRIVDMMLSPQTFANEVVVLELSQRLNSLVSEERALVAENAALFGAMAAEGVTFKLSAAKEKIAVLFSDENRRNLSLIFVRMGALLNIYANKLLLQMRTPPNLFSIGSAFALKSPDASSTFDGTASLASSREEVAELVISCLQTLAVLFRFCDDETRARHRRMFREEGVLRSLLALLALPEATKIRGPSREVVSLLIQGLEPKEQVRLVDLTFQDSNSHDLSGLAVLRDIVDSELMEIDRQVERLSTLKDQKEQLARRLRTACAVMDVESHKRGATVASPSGSTSTVIPSPRNSEPKPLPLSSTSIPSPPSAISLGGIDPAELMEIVSLKPSELPLISETPSSFVEFFGDFKRLYSGYGIVHQSSDPKWIGKYLVLNGDVLRLYESHNSDPVDADQLIFLSDDNGVSRKAYLDSIADRLFVVLSPDASGLSPEFRFCVHQLEDAMRWAHLFDPYNNPAPTSETIAKMSEQLMRMMASRAEAAATAAAAGALVSPASSSPESPSVSPSPGRVHAHHRRMNSVFARTLGTSVVGAEMSSHMKAGLALSALLDSEAKLCESIFNELGESIVKFGYLAVKASAEFPWRSAWCILLSWGEFRLFGTSEEALEDAWAVVRLKDEEDPAIVFAPYPSIEGKKLADTATWEQWSQRALVVRNNLCSFLFCARSAYERNQWMVQLQSAVKPDSTT